MWMEAVVPLSMVRQRLRAFLRQRRSLAFRLATAPGIILHELAHRLACLVVGVPVQSVAYFRLTGPPGYVKHATPSRWSTTAVIALAPLAGNATIAAVLLEYSLATYTGTGIGAVAVGGVLWWVAVAALIHSLPSSTDLGTVWAATTARWYRLPLAVVVGPLYALRRLAGVVGTYRLTVPLSLIALGGLLVLHDLSPTAFLDCVLAGRWGCWNGSPKLGSVLSMVLLALIDQLRAMLLLVFVS